MKNPKRKKAKPVLAWSISFRGKLVPDLIFTDEEAAWNFNDSVCDGGRVVRVEIREVKK